MHHFVYIIKSLMDGSLYKGYSSDPHNRLEQHNRAESRYTSKKVPWTLVYIEESPDKASALKREKSLKKANSQYIQWLMEQPTNLLKQK